MTTAADRIGPWMFDAAVAAMAWLSLVMLAMVACRQPLRRRDLGRWGLVGALLVPPLVALPVDRFGWLGPLAGTLGPLDEVGVGRRLAALWAGGLGRAAIVAYLVGLGVGLGWIALGGLILRRLDRRAEAPSAEARRLHESLPFRGRSWRRPRLRVSPRIGRPALIGLLRPAILVPASWDRPDEAERLRLGLLHELAHAERSDPIFHLLGGLARAVWFTLPPVWWIGHRLRVDQEFLADERAAGRLGGTSVSYASTLVAMAGGRTDGGRSSSADPAAVDPDGSPLVQRVAMLVRCPFPVEARTPLWWRLGLPPIAAAALFFASRLTVAGGGAPPPEIVPAVFRLNELRLDGGSSAPILLPPALPDTFRLRVEVFADRATLGALSVAGYRLRPSGIDRPEPSIATWHAVLLEVGGDGGLIWVDDQPAAALPDLATTSDRLALLVLAGRPCSIRNLVLMPGE